MRFSRFSTGITATAITVVLGISSTDRVSAQKSAAPAAASLGLTDALRTTTRMITPAVVQIFTTAYLPSEKVIERPSDLVSTERGSGSGVIVDSTGFIVTNAHVIQGAQRLIVEVPSTPAGKSILAAHSRLVGAKVVGIDEETDIAVLKIEGTGLPSLPFGDSDELSAGDLVLAFGSPMGLNNSVSLGIVSAVARQLEPESPMVYVQTDASVNPGSSGGPLVDVRGRIVGINTMINTRGGGNEGLAFAAPSNIVRTAYEQIRKNGHVKRGDIGVRAQTLTPTLAAGLSLTQQTGVILADVLPGGPAAKAGLQPGDVVLSINGKPMENGRQLQVTLYRHAVGEAIAVEVLRGGKAIIIPVRVAERQDSFVELPTPDPRENLVAKLGILAITLNPQIAQIIPVLRVTSGVVVASSVPGAIDARAGRLSAGDVIFGVNGKPIENLAELRAALEPLKTGAPVVLHLERRGVLMYLPFTAE
jgi:serine protease Do